MTRLTGYCNPEIALGYTPNGIGAGGMEVPRMAVRMPLIVRATWDDEAHVWVVTSDDVPGLVTEAPSLDVLIPKLKVLIPELLDANGYADGDEEIPFKLVSEINGITHREHA
jgi:predicted RNase H-like HicB family nuclease